MFSANGRLKPSKETANKKTKTTFTCQKCGHIMVAKGKVFGEERICTECGSPVVKTGTEE